MSPQGAIEPMHISDSISAPKRMSCGGRIQRRKLYKILGVLAVLIFALAILPVIIDHVHAKFPSTGDQSETDPCKVDVYNIVNYRYYAADHVTSHPDQPVTYANVSFDQSAISGEGGILKPASCHASEENHKPSGFDPNAVYDTFVVSDGSGARVFAITLEDVSSTGGNFNMSVLWVCAGHPYRSWTNVTLEPYECGSVDNGTWTGMLCKGPPLYSFTAEHQQRE
ncbi:hypothetical protein BU16DRAFT_562623 [Lophium mytilinum]|uniref:AA1-like domain-containing protein n=1 Tax=Lophium mytilinum TaxID=390894 RepID=A0A6A6QSB6_9PEZI|nr:hypothetical protein BU16DRAFT_562623 [Lophium mytilinum]